MNTQSFAAKMLSKFRNGLNSWISLWHFLVHLENLDFYEDGWTNPAMKPKDLTQWANFSRCPLQSMPHLYL